MAENLKPRQSAVRILENITERGLTSDEAFSGDRVYTELTDTDRRFVRLLVLTCLRRMGQVDGILDKLVKRPLPRGQKTARAILRLGITQGVFLKTPGYAFVNTSVSVARKMHLDGLTGFINGVLRGLTRLHNPLEGLESPSVNLPAWLYASWVQTYGQERVDAFAAALLEPPPLDITVPGEAMFWADKWGGRVLETGGVRLCGGSPEELTGFTDSRVWVQNGAASVPVQLFSDLSGKKAADLCAAPGGKTAQLIMRGAKVWAYDVSERRLDRLRENIERLNWADQVQIECADVLELTEKERFDAVLLDAPCSATGTLQRHPELKYIRKPSDIARLAETQQRLLRKAVALTKKGGEIVFSTCSLQPEEGDDVVRSVLKAGAVEVVPLLNTKWHSFSTDFGSLRFTPDQGYDGFYVCLLRKK